jgi:hypothetical protein
MPRQIIEADPPPPVDPTEPLPPVESPPPPRETWWQKLLRKLRELLGAG